ncbi:hypothetical protein BCR34DRAFT_591142 [Clohesyomyces aquaticus]|uniref:Uncharacterized protein n=1 Tax=Clohesyomyces aquaticus TaxID=1231657 RepID=A0A1Y1Z3A0_9PLEO|nr:hypothetical protein BCR34DRAFT_591142 [Clohesyomyces aquaticus]
MGNNDNNSNRGLRDDSTTLLLFTLFGILIVLFLLLILLFFQTWALWKIARVVVEQNTESSSEGRRTSRLEWFSGSTGGGSDKGGEKEGRVMGRRVEMGGRRGMNKFAAWRKG